MDKILSLEIVNFKTFKYLKIDDLDKNINFIYGKNNVGKTSILEAIVLLLRVLLLRALSNILV